MAVDEKRQQSLGCPRSSLVNSGEPGDAFVASFPTFGGLGVAVERAGEELEWRFETNYPLAGQEISPFALPTKLAQIDERGLCRARSSTYLRDQRDNILHNQLYKILSQNVPVGPTFACFACR